LEKNQKIIAIIGPTAVGKTGVAINIAKKFDGEIISADSRQIYKGMDIGTGKVTEKELKGIPYYLINILNPGKSYSALQFKKDAEATIEEITSRRKTPIIEGGTGFYVSTITEGINFPEVPANEKSRKELEKKSREELFEILRELDKERADTVDRNNKVRLIRAIEIRKALDKVPKFRLNPKYNVLKIGLDLNDRELREKINQRIEQRLKEGMIEEVKKLLEKGVSKDWLDKIGLEYRYISRFLEGEIEEQKMIEELQNKSWQYAKRQRTWFRKDKEIKWFSPQEIKKIEELIKKFV